MSSTTYRQLVLRLPDGLKQAMRERVESGFGLDGVEFTPVKKGSRRFAFTMNGETYPARLVDLPCLLETQKTLDKRTFFKSGDVGQMLIVYKDEIAYKRDEGSSSGVGPQNFFPDGLAPPTKNIVRRRFLKARPDRKKIDQTEVICVESQILKMHLEGSAAETSSSDKTKRPGGGGNSSSSASAASSNGGGSSRSGGGSSSKSSRTGGGSGGGSSGSGGGGSGGAGDKVTFEHEEIVDFEPWMADPEIAAVGRLEGITIEVTGPTSQSEANDASRGSLSHTPPPSAPRLFGSKLLYQHPEILLAKKEGQHVLGFPRVFKPMCVCVVITFSRLGISQADFMPDTGTARPSKKIKAEEGSADTMAAQAGADRSVGAAGVGKKPEAIEPKSKPGVIKPGGGQQPPPPQKQQPSRLRIVAAEKAKPSDTAGASPEPPTPGTDLVPDADVALNHMDDAETLDELGVEDIFLGVSGDLDDLPT